MGGFKNPGGILGGLGLGNPGSMGQWESNVASDIKNGAWNQPASWKMPSGGAGWQPPTGAGWEQGLQGLRQDLGNYPGIGKFLK